MRAAEANQGVRREREGDEAAGHCEISIEKRVRHVGGIAKNPEGDEERASCDRPKKDEPEAMNDDPKSCPTAHKSPK